MDDVRPTPAAKTAEPLFGISITLLRIMSLSVASAVVLFQEGFGYFQGQEGWAHFLQSTGFISFAILLGWRWRQTLASRQGIRGLTLDGALCILGLLAILPAELLEWKPAEVAIDLICVLLLGLQFLRLYVGLLRRYHSSPIFLPASMSGVILIGALMLKIPAAVPVDNPISWTDAAFTSASAVCVTGLGVRSTFNDFTPFGQVILLGLIQVGALGVTIFGSLLVFILGGSLSLTESLTISEAVHNLSYDSTREASPISVIERLIKFIIYFTFGMELLCACLLFFMLPDDRGLMRLAFDSLFHSVSAFCNAGFSTYDTSLVGFRSHLGILTTISVLIFAGGIGFPVLFNLWQILRYRFNAARKPGRIDIRPPKLTLHSRLALTTSFILIVGGGLAIAAGQYVQHLRFGEPEIHLSAAQRLIDGAFLSVTSRTAGFNSISMDQLGSVAIFITLVLMFIGGSPCSAAGGVKTLVLPVIALAMRAVIRQRPFPEINKRSINPEVVRRAGMLIMLHFSWITLATVTLAMFEPHSLRDVLFEIVSAMGTVGLSLGITAELSDAGRWVIIATMFVGRVGALSVLSAMLLRKPAAASYRFPEEGVLLG